MFYSVIETRDFSLFNQSAQALLKGYFINIYIYIYYIYYIYIYIHQNAINRHDHNSLPARHADDNGHNFDWSQTRCLGQATTNHAREFKEAWHSIVIA